MEREEIVATLKGHEVPGHLINGLSRYLFDGCRPGFFLRAVLENDLMGACIRADIKSMHALNEIVAALYFDFPTNCYGSPERVQAWIESGGLNGREDAED